MINQVFADLFIDRIRQYSNYPFLVFNPDGRIIAATDTKRVGTFHEASYEMMKHKRQIAVVEPRDVYKYFGAQPGVDMPILYKNEIVGAIGITGLPEETKPIVLIAKMAVESMLEYETYMETERMKNTEADRFSYLLMMGTANDEVEMHSYAESHGFRTDLLRVPIVFMLSDPEIAKTICQELNRALITSDQDLVFVNNMNWIVFFKAFNISVKDFMINYKEVIAGVAEMVESYLVNYRVTEKSIVGSAQKELKYYSSAYQHCIWMYEKGYENAFFYDHTNEYLKSKIPMTTYREIFNIADNALLEDIGFASTLRALKQSNYNMTAASKSLYMHKNTFATHMKKIREALGVDPMRSASERSLLEGLLHYTEGA